MNNKLQLPVLLFAFLFVSCSDSTNDSNESNNENTSAKTKVINDIPDTISNQIDRVETPDLFNLNPEVAYTDIADLHKSKTPNMFYFSGLIGDYDADLILIQDRYNLSEYMARYLISDSGKSSELRGKNTSIDSINLQKNDDLGESEVLYGHMNKNEGTFNGLFIVGSDSLTFDLKLKRTTPTQNEIFIGLAEKGELYHTEEGVISTYFSSIDFNDFYVSTAEGEGYDFSEVSYELDESIHFYDSNFLFTGVEIMNEMGTKFKEGHEPTGPDDQDFIAEGEYNYATISIQFKWLENGILMSDFIDFQEDFNCTPWLFENNIIITAENPQIGNNFILYHFRWNPETNKYENKM